MRKASREKDVEVDKVRVLRLWREMPPYTSSRECPKCTGYLEDGLYKPEVVGAWTEGFFSGDIFIEGRPESLTRICTTCRYSTMVKPRTYRE